MYYSVLVEGWLGMYMSGRQSIVSIHSILLQFSILSRSSFTKSSTLAASACVTWTSSSAANVSKSIRDSYLSTGLTRI